MEVRQIGKIPSQGMWLEITNQSQKPLFILMEMWAVGPIVEPDQKYFIFADGRGEVAELVYGEEVLSVFWGDAALDTHGRVIYDFSDERLPMPGKGVSLHQTINAAVPGMWLRVTNSSKETVSFVNQPMEEGPLAKPGQSFYIYLSDEREIGRLEYSERLLAFRGALAIADMHGETVFKFTNHSIPSVNLLIGRQQCP